MKPAIRAFLGATLGALLTLAFHPASRPFILGSASRLSVPQVESIVELTATRLHEPKDLIDAGEWLQLGLRRFKRGLDWTLVN